MDSNAKLESRAEMDSRAVASLGGGVRGMRAAPGDTITEG